MIKRLFIILLCIIFFAYSGCTPTPPAPENPPIEAARYTNFFTQDTFVYAEGSTVYVADKEGNMIIPAGIYSEIGTVTEGLSLAKKNGLYGFIDEAGEIKIPFMFTEAHAFCQGLAIVYWNEKYGMINQEGNLKIPAIYDAIFSYNGATWHVRRNGKNGLLDKNGKEVLPVEYSSIWEPSDDICVIVKDETLYGFCRTNGSILAETIYDRTDAFNEGYGLIEKGGKCGLMDTQGNIAVPMEYEWIDRMFEGSFEAQKNGKHGRADAKQKILVPFLYDSAAPIRDGFSIVSKNGLYGAVKQGVEVIPCQYNSMTWFSENHAIVGNGEYYGLLSGETGRMITDYSYDNMTEMHDGMCGVKDTETGLWGFIDATGTRIIDCKYTNGDHFSEGLAPVCFSDGKYGYIDKTGTLVIACQFIYAEPFHEGIAVVAKDSGYGYIDTSGNIILPLIYNQTNAFFGGKGHVLHRLDSFFVDQSGNRIDENSNGLN